MIPEGVRVEVYKNLHKDLWSVRSASGVDRGRVIAHTDRIVLRDASFVVQQGGRARVLREGQKNVHAFVRGYTTEVEETPEAGHSVRYNPFEMETFVLRHNNAPILRADLVVMEHPRVVAFRAS